MNPQNRKEMITSIFCEDNIRVHMQGFPDMVQDSKALEDLLNPAVWFESQTACGS